MQMQLDILCVFIRQEVAVAAEIYDVELRKEGKIQFSQSMICRVQVVSDCDTLNI